MISALNDILANKNPDRSALTSSPGSPTPHPLRTNLTPRVGAVINMIANHFKLNTAATPREISQFSVAIFKYDRKRPRKAEGGDAQEQEEVLGEFSIDLDRNLASDVDITDTLQTYPIMQRVLDDHPEWQMTPPPERRPIGITYDGRATLFATHPLDLKTPPREPVRLPSKGTAAYDHNKAAGLPVGPERINKYEGGEPPKDPKEKFEQDVSLGSQGHLTHYRVTITYATDIYLPDGNAAWQQDVASYEAMRALDSALLSFARWGTGASADPKWLVIGAKCFRNDSPSALPRLSNDPAHVGFMLVAMHGYYTSLKQCFAGLTLVCDMNVSAFLVGGDMVDLMVRLGWKIMPLSRPDLILI